MIIGRARIVFVSLCAAWPSIARYNNNNIKHSARYRVNRFQLPETPANL